MLNSPHSRLKIPHPLPSFIVQNIVKKITVHILTKSRHDSTFKMTAKNYPFVVFFVFLKLSSLTLPLKAMRQNRSGKESKRLDFYSV